MKEDNIKVKLFRYNPVIDRKPRYKEYEIPKKPKMRILDVLHYIKENYDSSLTFRYSCRYYNKCGSCAVTINGTPGLACYEEAIDGMVIEPLRNFPILKDLAIDRKKIDQRQMRMRPFFERARPFKEEYEKILFSDYEAYKELVRCMECWSCIAACPAVDALIDFDKEFPGPGILVKLSKYAMDPRDSGSRGRTAFFEGVYDCTICEKCTEVCPWEIDAPKIVMEKLRQIAVEEQIGPLIGHQEFTSKISVTGRTVDKITKPLLEEIPEVITVNKPKDTVGFFTGCLADYRLQHIGKALLNVLEYNEIEVHTLPSQVCCGSPLIRTGQIIEAEELVRKNLEVFKKAGITTIISLCPGCTMTLKENYPEYSRRFKLNEPKYKIYHVTEFLINNIQLNKLDMKKLNLTVTYHDPCHLKRGIGVKDEPRNLIKAIPGVNFIELEESDRCCGAGGGMRSGKRELGYLMGEKKLKHITTASDHGAKTLVSSCPFCLIQLNDIVKSKGIDTNVIDIIELLDKAYQ